MSGRATGADHVYLADVVADAGEKQVAHELRLCGTSLAGFPARRYWAKGASNVSGLSSCCR